MTIETWTAFFGWLTVLNIAYLLIATVAITMCRPWTARIHHKLTGLDDKDLNRAYFGFLANYKILTLATSLAPYLALRIM